MADKSSKNEMVRKLTKVGRHSISVTLPIRMVKDLGWREKQKVTIKKIHGGFTIREHRK